MRETLRDLQSDLNAVYELTDSINRLFSVTSFVDAVRSVQKENNVNLVQSLERALESCSRGAHSLINIPIPLGLDTDANCAQRTYKAWRLDRRLDDIDRLKRNFLGLHSVSLLGLNNVRLHRILPRVSLTRLNRCKQMQIAERDAQHANDLKTQIGELRKAIEQVSQQITSRHTVAVDENTPRYRRR